MESYVVKLGQGYALLVSCEGDLFSEEMPCYLGYVLTKKKNIFGTSISINQKGIPFPADVLRGRKYSIDPAERISEIDEKEIRGLVAILNRTQNLVQLQQLGIKPDEILPFEL